MSKRFADRALYMGLAGAFIILMTVCFFASPHAAILAQEEGTSPETLTGPIDPAAGSWILYRGERSVPNQPAPQTFFTRITYDYPSGTPQEGTVLEATVEELGPQLRVTSSRSFTVQTRDRSYEEAASGEEGFWVYWLPPGIEEGASMTIESGINLKAEETSEYDFKGNKYKTIAMRGEGVELLVGQRTGLTFQLKKEDGTNLKIEDTNMLAQYASWGYFPDNVEVGKRLDELAGKYPDLVEASSLGKSAKGRDLWLAHITDFTSNTSDVDKRSVFISAAMEGNAPEGSDFILDLLEEIARKAQEDEELADLLTSLDIYAMPLVNPDGLQRWLAMPNPQESEVLSSQAPRNGDLVMINRNFDIRWEAGNRNPASADYAGSAPFSEPESRALGELFDDIPFSLYINLHSGPALLNAPWNWSSQPSFNPEKGLYESIISELFDMFPYPMRVGGPLGTFTGSGTDWAYEGNGASSPLCFDMYLEEPKVAEGGAGDAQASITELKGSGSISLYAPYWDVLYHLLKNIDSYLDVEIITPKLQAEVNLPLDVEVEVKVNGRRDLPDAKARLVLPSGTGLKLAAMSEKDMVLGDLKSGDTAEVSWNLEGKTSGTYPVEVVITSSYPQYDNIPGTYDTSLEIVISTQRTWLVVVLLTLLILLVLGLVFLSMRKHKREGKL